MEPFKALDLWVLEKINQEWTHPLLDTFFVWLTKPPHENLYFVVAALLLITLGGARGRRAVLWVGLAVLLSDQISASVLKPLFERVRPCFEHPDTVRLVMEKQSHSPSFPSSHATNAFSVAVVLFSVRRWLGWGVLVLAFLISYSRPYVGVHYPSDVFAGAILGAVLGGSCLLLKYRFECWRSVRRGADWSKRDPKSSDDGRPDLESPEV